MHSDLGLAGAVIVARLIASTADVWFGAANFGSLPAVVGDRARVVEATAMISTATTAISLVVPAGAVIVMHLVGPFPLFALNAVTFLVAAWLRWRIREISPSDREVMRLTVALRSSGRDVVAGVRHLFGHPLIRTVTIAGVLGATASGAISALIAVFAVDVFGIAADDPRQGAFLTAGALGVIAFTWLLPVLYKKLRPLGVLMLLQALAAVTGLLLTTSPTLWVAVAVFGLFSAWSTLLITNGITLRMQLLPDHLQGRVGSAGRLIAWAGTPIGGILAGVLAGVLPIRLVFALTLIIWVQSIGSLAVIDVRDRRRQRQGGSLKYGGTP